MESEECVYIFLIFSASKFSHLKKIIINPKKVLPLPLEKIRSKK